MVSLFFFHPYVLFTLKTVGSTSPSIARDALKKNPNFPEAWANEFTIGTRNLGVGPGNPEKVFNEVEGGCHGLGVVVVGVFLVLGEFARKKGDVFCVFDLSPLKNIEGDCVSSKKSQKNKVGGFYIYLLR